MKNRNQPGLFDQQDRVKKLNSLRDPLVSIGETIHFEQFREILERATLQDSYAKGGRPPFDRVMLFKALLLQKIYDLSDDQLEYQINDRLSFMRFLGLQLSDKVPDAKTFWFFRESLTKTGVIDQAFVMFRDRLRAHGYMLQKGKIVDASLVKMKFIELTPQVLLFIILGVILGCTKDDLKKDIGYATPSFGSKEWKFESNFGQGGRPNSIYIKLTHYNDNGLLNVIEIVNIPKSDDTTFLTHFKEVPNIPIDTFQAYFFVQLDEDALGEGYVVDTSNLNLKSYIVLEEINNRKVTGSFQINFILSPDIDTNFPKFDETIPDTFNVSNGRFSAEKF